MSTEPIDGVVFEEDDDGYVVRFDSDDGSEAEPEPEPTPEPEPEPEPEPTLEPEAGLEGQGDEPFEFDEELDEMVEIDPNADNLDEVFARLSAGEPVARIFSNATATFSGHTDAVYALALSPDAAVAASGGGDDKLRVWSTADGSELVVIDSFAESVAHVAFSADGGYLAGCDLDGNVRVLKTGSWEVVLELDGPDGAESMVWHPRGNVLVVSSTDTTVWMWHVPSGKIMNVFAGHTDAVTVCGFAADGKTLISGSADESLIVWSPKTGSPVSKVVGYPFHDAPISSLAVDPRADAAPRVATGALDGSVRVTSLESGKVLASMTHEGSVEAIAWCSFDDKWLATAGMDGNVVVWDLSVAAPRITLEHKEGVIGVTWVPNQPLLYTLSSDTSIRVWDARSGECIRTLRAHEDIPLAWAVSADATCLISGGDDRKAYVFAPLDLDAAKDNSDDAAASSTVHAHVAIPPGAGEDADATADAPAGEASD
ncbi:transducin family protein [Thecamonas trahens ATCC 50062]|uniref:Transducin family protein n=1 Tax=Thecamonas trahens ATCC 50062 TaxID=461836 RepID=A0A0L0DE17_THETB|nr:transducin family protein [Thecamonas trahens ATCC 50062]KNC50544.1 transducin family protein [Thecamonas trahens ATCC 50062]|eukprot:XP_013762436.1 transducin family protein [Thecamonas trahens ATCC 50062]